MKFSERERKAEGQVRLHRARGSAELREVVSGSAMQSLLAEKRKSEISGKRHRQSRFPGRRTVRRAKERVYRFRVRPR